MNKEPLFPNVKINLLGPDGNAYAIMGIIARILRQMGKPQSEINEVLKEMMSSDYKHLCEIASNYVTLIGDEE